MQGGRKGSFQIHRIGTTMFACVRRTRRVNCMLSQNALFNTSSYKGEREGLTVDNTTIIAKVELTAYFMYIILFSLFKA